MHEMHPGCRAFEAGPFMTVTNNSCLQPLPPTGFLWVIYDPEASGNKRCSSIETEGSVCPGPD